MLVNIIQTNTQKTLAADDLKALTEFIETYGKATVHKIASKLTPSVLHPMQYLKKSLEVSAPFNKSETANVSNSRKATDENGNPLTEERLQELRQRAWWLRSYICCDCGKLVDDTFKVCTCHA
ncbi:MAG: hypothetical protein V1799_09710 [bacterium]